MRDTAYEPEHSDPAASAGPDREVNSSPVVQSRETPRSVGREIFETLLLAVFIFVAVRAVVLNFRVDGHSMDPSLDNNEMLLVNRNAYLDVNLDDWFSFLPGVEDDGQPGWYPFGTPERGDIVVLNPPETVETDKPYIKRVIGLPGDQIDFRDRGVYIDGIRLQEPYLEGISTKCSREPNCSLTIPDGYVYVMGDNRNNSSDSREFGIVPIDNIIGKAWITYWPSDDIGIVPHNEYKELDSGG